MEEQRVHRVQIDVSVIDPRGDERASVPNLSRDAFLIRLDGRPLPPEVRERVEFDEMCGGPGPAEGTILSPGAPESADPSPTLIVVADLNFLDLQMRHAVHKALLDLARIAETRPLRVKIIRFGRDLSPLTPEFTSDPAEIRRAAARLVGTIATGPPRAPDAADATDVFQDASEKRPEDMDHQYGFADPPDPDRPKPALSVDPEGIEGETATIGLEPPEFAPDWELARRQVDPRPSLAALEAVMLSHSAIRGRKALVLFSSAWFDLPEEMFLSYTEGPRLAAQSGFTIWSVDARGLGGTVGATTHSRLLGHLATSNGGEAIRSAGRLAIGFERALAQLSCYYLFSIPVERPARGTRRYHVDVRLDTGKYPDTWRYRIRSPTAFTLLDPLREGQRRRMAALMEPHGYGFPRIRVTAGYPSEESELETPVEVSVLLADLAFLRDPEKDDLFAEFSWEGVVRTRKGRHACTLGDGRRRVVRSATPPLRHPPSLLVLRDHCALPEPGLYDIRVVVEDFIGGDVGAGTALLEISEPAASVTGVSSIRLGRNSGRDFVIDPSASGSTDVVRDKERRAFGPLLAGEAISPEERLVLRFVTCKEDAPPRVILYRHVEGEAGERVAAALYQVLVSPRAVMKAKGGTCREMEGIVPESSLSPGTYGLVFIERDVSFGSREVLDDLIANREAGAFVEFKVALPPRPADDVAPEREARLRARSSAL